LINKEGKKLSLFRILGINTNFHNFLQLVTLFLHFFDTLFLLIDLVLPQNKTSIK